MKRFFLCVSALFFSFLLQAKPVELVFWHGMAGHLGDEVQSLADEFNQTQRAYFIKPVYKGNYVETLTSFAAAFRARKPPHLVQVFEVGMAIMVSPKGVIKPVEELMMEQGMRLPKEDFIPAARELYSLNGQLMAMPFNLSAPVIYYNKQVLAQAGYGSANFPRTWAEMEVLAQHIKKLGYQCVYTSAYPGWVLLESYLAIHGLSLVEDNSLHTTEGSVSLRHHLKRLRRWQQKHYFKYGGRADDATILFTSGVCPLLSQSSGAYNSLSSLVPFDLGVAVMPLDTQVSRRRFANVVGGAAIWVVSGQTAFENRGVSQFLLYLAKPETQKRWHEQTGYLPIGLKGIYAAILQSSHHPVLQLAQHDLEVTLTNKKTLRSMGPQNQIRKVNDDVLEAMFSGAMSAEDALQDMVLRANHIRDRFGKNTQ